MPEVLTQCRSRLADALMDDLVAMQAAAAMAEGLGSPAPLGIETFPAAQGRPRVTAAAPLDTAPKKSASASTPARRQAPRQRPR